MTNTADSIVATYLKKHDPIAYISALDKAFSQNVTTGLGKWLPDDKFFGVGRTKAEPKYGFTKDGKPRKKPGRQAKV